MKIASIAAVVVALFAAGSASASPVNLITNGDFESVAPGYTFSSGFHVVNSGSSAIGAWTVGASSVDLIRNAYNAINGYSIDMLGTPGPGFLSQSFNVVAGQTYNLAFDMARNPGGPAGQGVAVNFGGVTQNFYSTAAASNTLYSNTLSFTAASTGLATLSFASA
ncbi:MAG: choice-of-anchor C family protein, partial [Janthinobacterium sp.]